MDDLMFPSWWSAEPDSPAIEFRNMAAVPPGWIFRSSRFAPGDARRFGHVEAE